MAGPDIREYRIVLPMTLDEVKNAYFYTLCTTAIAETGGGEGVEIVKQEPFETAEMGKGYYYHKILHLASKVPKMIRILAPKGSLEIHCATWNRYPECKTVYSNPDYMKDGFHTTVTTKFIENDSGAQENVFGLSEDKLAKRDVVTLDIVNDPVSPSDYSAETDPGKVRLETVNRGPLEAGWKDSQRPLLCVYKLVEVEFKWFGLQDTVQSRILKFLARIYRIFHRTLYCNLDKCNAMTMDDIRKMEDETKTEVDKLRSTGEVRGATEQ